ncbi:ABC transporter permease, partial [Paenibacillus darwinianus]
MDRSLEAIRGQRADAWRKETVPYWRYMGQSGFPGFVALAVMSGLIGYIAFLRRVPPDFPIAEVGAAVLLPFLAWSPLRSYLVSADTVFLMPRESGMRAWLRPAGRAGVMLSGLLLLMVFLAYVPLYRQGTVPAAWPLIALALLPFKAANAWGAWTERRMAWPMAARLFRLLRWAATVLVLAALLSQPLWESAPFGLLAAAALAAAYRLPSKHRFPWERLIEEEWGIRRRWYRFFGTFIDVPVSGDMAVARRSYLTWTAAALKFKRSNAYTFLYAGTLLRTELGGIVLRLTLLGMLTAVLTGRAELLSGWGAVAAGLGFILLTGVQLGALSQAHRHSVWRHVYPLPESQREASLLAVVRWVLAGSSLLVWLSVAATLAPAGKYAQ